MAPLAESTGKSQHIVKNEFEAAPVEEAADYGDEPSGEAAAKPEPLRAMPDYADLVDDEQGGATNPSRKRGRVAKSEAKSEPRPEAIHVSGVQRLTRTHLAEVFDSKNLPSFVSVEWVADDQVLIIFANVQDAATALVGALRGFGDTMAEMESNPGPGLWRAQRGMLDFREATRGDVPDMGWRKQHRGGRQVREFRFWSAMEDLDKNILAGEDGKDIIVPSGEDALGAWDDGDTGEDALFEYTAPVKRLRITELKQPVFEGEGVAKEDDASRLLEQMADEDKKLLADERVAKLAVWKPGNAKDDSWNDWGGNWWDDRSWSQQGTWGNENRGAWQHDDRGEPEQAWDNQRSRNKSSWNPRKRWRDEAPQQGSGSGPVISWGAVDDEERVKRSRRSERFTAAPLAPKAEGTAAR